MAPPVINGGNEGHSVILLAKTMNMILYLKHESNREDTTLAVRRETLIRLVMLTITLVGALHILFSAPALADAQAVSDQQNIAASKSFTPLWGPYLTGTSSSSTVINIKTADTSTVTVSYAEETYYNINQTFNKSAVDGVAGLLHHITLNTLEPGTTYCYQVSCNGQNTPVYSFSTFPAAGPFSFVVYGDSQDELPNFSQAERHKLVADRIAAEPNILFVLHTGDLVNDGNDNANWDRYFDAARPLGAQKPVFPAHGKHDGNTIFYDIFGISPYYSFDCAGVHFTILDSIDEPAGQIEWLKEDLAETEPWKFVFFHYPMYTSEANHFGGWENLQSEWENIFITNQVDAVWNGHIHVYERYLENGIMYIVGGTGGGPYGTLETPKSPGYQNSLERSLGYSKVTVDPGMGTAAIQFIRVADISIDGKQVTLLPPGSVFDTYALSSPPLIGMADSGSKTPEVTEYPVGGGENRECLLGSIWARFKFWIDSILKLVS